MYGYGWYFLVFEEKNSCMAILLKSKAVKLPRAGFEPARPCGHYPLKVASLPIPPPGPD